MSETTTVAAGPTFTLCRCCMAHGDATMLPQIVRCVECGEPCSCDGCVAEGELRENGETDE